MGGCHDDYTYMGKETFSRERKQWTFKVTNDLQECNSISNSKLRLVQAGMSILLASKVFDVNLKQAAWFSAVPWGTMAISGYVAGTASDFLIKSGYSTTSARKIMQSIGFIGPGIALLCLDYVRTPTIAAVFLTAALSLSSFSQAGFLLNRS